MGENATFPLGQTHICNGSCWKDQDLYMDGRKI